MACWSRAGEADIIPISPAMRQRDEISIGDGELAGKGVYANRAFQEGDVVIRYRLRPLTKEEYTNLPDSEKMFTHVHWNQIYLYGVPERYVNHSANPNTSPDLRNQCDVAIRAIAKGEMITTDSSMDDV